MFIPSEEERAFRERLYRIPSYVDIIICPLTIFIVIYVRIPASNKAFKVVQIGIIVCSFVATSIISLVCPALSLPPSLYSVSSSCFNWSELFILFNVFLLFYFIHGLLTYYIMLWRVVVLMPTKWANVVKRVALLALSIIILLLLSLVIWVDYLIIQDKNAEKTSIGEAIRFSDVLYLEFFAVEDPIRYFSIFVCACTFLVCIIAIVLLIVLPRVNRHLSQKTIIMHNLILRVTVAQIILAMFAIVAPIFFIVIILTSSPQDSGAFSWPLAYSPLMTTTHSSGNCLIILLVTKFYREFLIKCLNRLRKKAGQVLSISPVRDNT